MGFDLSILWFVIIVFSVVMYVAMDGFDLGVGMLLLFAADRDERDVMVNSVAPVWDGNETWIVLGGAGLMGAFPLAYSVVLDAFAIPATLMLLALIFRGVAFEFRVRALDSHQDFWEKALAGGSLLASFFQGVMAGALVQGLPVVKAQYAGTNFDWLTPFSVFCGIGLVVAYLLLGSTWLVLKSEGALQERLRVFAQKSLVFMAVILFFVSVWTPLQSNMIASRWFSAPNLYYLWLLPAGSLSMLILAKHALAKGHEYTGFVCSLGVILSGFAGLGISVWPNIIPPGVSIWEAAAPPQSQGFMLVGALFIIPFILGYSFWSYHVFSGKVKIGEGYH